MASFNRILVPLDFSDCSQDLIDQAAALSDDSTHVILLYVAHLPDGLPPNAHVGSAADRHETAEHLLVRRSRERLEQYRSMLAAEVHSVVGVVAEGDPAETILREAASRDVDLVIMGTHGRRGVAKAVGGSVAAEVVSKANCPVLTLRTQHKRTCSARSCDRCDGHLTLELRQLMVEREG